MNKEKLLNGSQDNKTAHNKGVDLKRLVSSPLPKGRKLKKLVSKFKRDEWCNNHCNVREIVGPNTW